MSYREIREFVETMRALGYPHLISIESFRSPNFKLVADCLFWLTNQYDSSAEIPDDIDSDDARAAFLKAVAQAMYNKARVKLNIRNCYRADGHAVKELLKVSSLLLEAMTSGAMGEQGVSIQGKPDIDVTSSTSSSIPGLDPSFSKLTPLQLMQKLDEVKNARTTSREIVDCGERLSGLLVQEESVRVVREQTLSFIDSISKGAEGGRSDPNIIIRREIAEQLDMLTANVAAEQHNVDVSSKEEKQLQLKLTQVEEDIQRMSKRIETTKSVRPSFMIEFDQLENELKKLYNIYIEKFRNVQYLESELERLHKAESDRKEEADEVLRRIQRKARSDEMRALRGGDDDDLGGSRDFMGMTMGLGGTSGGSGVGGEGDDDGDGDDDDDDGDLMRKGGKSGIGKGNIRLANSSSGSSNLGVGSKGIKVERGGRGMGAIDSRGNIIGGGVGGIGSGSGKNNMVVGSMMDDDDDDDDDIGARKGRGLGSDDDDDDDDLGLRSKHSVYRGSSSLGRGGLQDDDDDDDDDGEGGEEMGGLAVQGTRIGGGGSGSGTYGGGYNTNTYGQGKAGMNSSAGGSGIMGGARAGGSASKRPSAARSSGGNSGGSSSISNRNSNTNNRMGGYSNNLYDDGLEESDSDSNDKF